MSSTRLTTTHPPGTAEASARVRALAESLRSEFAAPIGVVDTEQPACIAFPGVSESCLPPITGPLPELRSAKVSVWPDPRRPHIHWLILPLSSRDHGNVAAFARFRTPGPDGETFPRIPPEESSAGNEAEACGPACPERALLAWGREVQTRFLGAQTGNRPVMHNRPAMEESDHVVIGRLIRRMKISESPRRFQALATNVLKASLGMAAVAWVPVDSCEEIVVSGSIEGMRSSSYRNLIPAAPRDAEGGSAEGRIVASGSGTPPVHRYVSVSVGSSGWLVAANPTRDEPPGTPEIERMQYVASLIATQASNARTYAELKDLLFGIIRALTAAIDAKDPYTSGHSERVARIAVRLAEELEIPLPKRSDLYLTGLLHDIGKIGIDDVVLKKSGPLTSEEYRKIQEHVEIGVTILKDLKKLSHIIPGVRHHHESMDGSGYPDHLSGEEIPLEARILAVADSFDAMSSNRPYRKRLTPMQIDDILRKGRGVQWDPAVIDALFSCRMDVEAIRQKGLGESLIGAVSLALGRA
jgi:putative nucleotidyltransferase with HDIG domain